MVRSLAFLPIGPRAVIRLAMIGLAIWAAPAVWVAPASAQTMTCRQIEAELAQATPARDSAPLQQAASHRRRYQEIAASLSAYGCGNAASAFAQQCGALRQEATALVARINQIEGAARQAADPNRRAQLKASYDAHCRTAARPAQPAPAAQAQAPDIFDRLFGQRAAQPAATDVPGYATGTVPDAFRRLDEEAQRRDVEAQKIADAGRRQQASRLPVCVRTCDGFFFPVNYQGAQDQYGDVCRASCPGAKVELYYMSPGAEIETAVSARGAPYTALAAASAYRKTFDSACSCKGSTQSWGSALQQAEGLIRRRGDVIVTAEASRRPDPAETGIPGAEAADAAEGPPALRSEIDPQQEAPPLRKRVRDVIPAMR